MSVALSRKIFISLLAMSVVFFPVSLRAEGSRRDVIEQQTGRITADRQKVAEQVRAAVARGGHSPRHCIPVLAMLSAVFVRTHAMASAHYGRSILPDGMVTVGFGAIIAPVTAMHFGIFHISRGEISARLNFYDTDHRFTDALTLFAAYLNEKKEIDASSVTLLEPLLIEMADLTRQLPRGGGARNNARYRWQELLALAATFEKTWANAADLPDPDEELRMTVIGWIRREAKRAGVDPA